MAYRRKQGMQRSATFVEDHRHKSSGDASSPAIASPRATRFADDGRRPDRSLAAKAMLASSAARGGTPTFATERFLASSLQPAAARARSPAKDPVTQLHTSMGGGRSDDLRSEQMRNDEAKHGFWGVLAQQAKVMLDENGSSEDHALNSSGGRGTQLCTPPFQPSSSQSRWSYDRVRKLENPTLDIGGKIKNVLEEGMTKAEGNRSGIDVLHARKLQIRRKTCSMDMRGTNLGLSSPDNMSPMFADPESPQIKASRDVANAMAAKVKLLQRELKTVKADLAFSKERCAQLEDENRLLRNGNANADEDMIRQQLETLLAEKARLANENTLYTRENRFLREIVEYHQLNMGDVVNIDEEEGEDEEEDDDDDAGQTACSDHRMREAACPGTGPQSPSGHAGMTRMSRSDSGTLVSAAPESPTRPSFMDEDIGVQEEDVGLPETPPTRRSFEEDNDFPDTTTMHQSLKEDNGLPETPSGRRSFKEDTGLPNTLASRRSFKEDTGLPETPSTRRSFKEDIGLPDTPTSRRSFKEDSVSPGTPPSHQSFKEDIGLPKTPPTSRSFKEDIGLPNTRSFKEGIGLPNTPASHRSFKEDSILPDTPTSRRSFKEDIGLPWTPPGHQSFKEDIGLPETPSTRRSFKEDTGSPETMAPTRRSFKGNIGSTESMKED